MPKEITQKETYRGFVGVLVNVLDCQVVGLKIDPRRRNTVSKYYIALASVHLSSELGT